MIDYVLQPKRTQLMEARINSETPTFTVRVPENDEELLAIVGTDETGKPRLTFASLAQETIALRQQAVISKYLAENAQTFKDEKGKVQFSPDQFVDEAEQLDIIRRAEPEAYRLLVGDRATSTRQNAAQIAAAVRQEEQAAQRAQNVAMCRALAEAGMVDAALMMARTMGLTEIEAEFAK